jgi:nucleoside-diphosphate-sugar epimerase
MMSTKPLVLLTGVNGYVGAAILDLLLKKNYRTRGVVRSLSKTTFFTKKYSSASASGDLTFVAVPDIQAPGALDEAASDVDYILHVASPFFLSTSDPIKELVEPAVLGTRNAVASAIKAKKLKRLVVTSSFAAVVDLKKSPRPGYAYTEKDWNPVTETEAASSGSLGYYASKTFAEKSAWDMVREAQNEGKITWNLVTMNPPMVYGPPEHEIDASKGIDGLNTSLKGLITNITKPEGGKVPAPGLHAWVDVRDLAEAHVKALEIKEAGAQRFLVSGGAEFYEDGLGELRKRGEKQLAGEGPKAVISERFTLDTTKAREVLGLNFHTIEQTITDTWDRLKELKVF